MTACWRWSGKRIALVPWWSIDHERAPPAAAAEPGHRPVRRVLGLDVDAAACRLWHRPVRRLGGVDGLWRAGVPGAAVRPARRRARPDGGRLAVAVARHLDRHLQLPLRGKRGLWRRRAHRAAVLRQSGVERAAGAPHPEGADHVRPSRGAGGRPYRNVHPQLRRRGTAVAAHCGGVVRARRRLLLGGGPRHHAHDPAGRDGGKGVPAIRHRHDLRRRHARARGLSQPDRLVRGRIGRWPFSGSRSSPESGCCRDCC